MTTLSPSQCRAARALLGWSQPELARRCGVHVQTVSNFESESNRTTLTKSSLDKIERTLDRAGIEFLSGEGVRKKNSQIKIYEGRAGFWEFFDNVYETVKAAKGEVLVSNVDEAEFTRWLQEYGIVHKKRMLKVIKAGGVYYKILIKEGDYNFAVPEYGEYRWVEESRFQKVPFYVYGDNLGIMLFKPNGVTVYVLQEKEITEAYKVQFDYMWTQAKKIPKKIVKPTIIVSED